VASHPDEHVIVHVPNHEAKAQDLLLWQDRGRPRLEALVASFGTGAQMAEALSWAVIVGTSTLQAAEGVNLDRWGALVGEQRGGLDNEQYRTFIELRQLVNTTFPNEDRLWTVVSTAVDPSPARVWPLYPGGLKVIVASTDWLSDVIVAHIQGLIRDFRPAGTIVPIIEFVPDHMALDWEADAPLISFLSAPAPGNPVVSRLIYSGRGPA
jgi:hypothetical protein